MLYTLTKTDIKSSLVELKCFHPKSNKNRNTIISMKQRKIMTASKCPINPTKMLNLSLIGPTKNLHVTTGVIIILLTTIILHICANSLFFNDLFLKVIHPQNCNQKNCKEKENYGIIKLSIVSTYCKVELQQSMEFFQN